jgi:hypothetical protein
MSKVFILNKSARNKITRCYFNKSANAATASGTMTLNCSEREQEATEESLKITSEDIKTISTSWGYTLDVNELKKMSHNLSTSSLRRKIITEKSKQKENLQRAFG